MILAGATLFGVAGCHAHTEPAYVEARVAPVGVYHYPWVYYEGRPVYLIDGRWYFHDGRRWRYYRQEPRVLYRERLYIEAAPRAPARRRYDAAPLYREPPVRQSAPPARRSAPPARRVR